jgi:hypothetical protein
MNRHHYFSIVAAGMFVFAAACSTTTSPGAPGSPTSPSVAAADPVKAPTAAHYGVTFAATWSASTHPVDFPSTAHFSPLVGATHSARITFWRDGETATDGIKDMAERGLTSTLAQEVSTAIAAGTAEHVLTGGNIAISPGVVMTEFDISQSYPLVTLVSMIAPSPDWFVGVSAVPLFQDGSWLNERRVDLAAWDAGTDGGVTFLSPDLPLVPRTPIFRLVTAPLSPSGGMIPLGTFTFRRVQ